MNFELEIRNLRYAGFVKNIIFNQSSNRQANQSSLVMQAIAVPGTPLPGAGPGNLEPGASFCQNLTDDLLTGSRVSSPENF